MRVQGLSSICLGIVSLFAAACVAGEDPTFTTGTGTAEVRVDTAQLTDWAITRVSVEASGLTQDLSRDPATGVFAGALVLPVGVHDLVARAYANADEVGVSNPVTIDIQAGAVTRVSVRILDTTGGEQPDYGPIVESLTYPTSAEVGTPVTFAISVVDPDGDPVSIAWASDCADSTFTAPLSATTDWSKSAQGSCRITATASAGGLSVSESFSIVVFPAGSASGAANVDGTFVSAPYISMGLYYDNASCDIWPEGTNASCTRATASPNLVSVNVYVQSWANSAPGTIELFDSCGGAAHVNYQDSYSLYATWLPPVQGAVCFVSVRAINGDGVAGTLSAAVLVRDGTPRVVSPPNIFAELYHSNGLCQLPTGVTSDCGPGLPGDLASFIIQLDWRDGIPGPVSVTDDCGGVVSLYSPMDPFRIHGSWTLPTTPGVTCNLQVDAVNLEGFSSRSVGTFRL